MIAFALLNWRWLLPSAVAAVLSLWLGVTKLELANARAEIAHVTLAIETQKAEAAQQLADATSKVRAKEREMATATQEATERHGQDISAIDDAHRRNLDLARQLRTRSASRPRCDGPVPGAPEDSNRSPSPDPGQPDVLPGPIDSSDADDAFTADQYLSALRLCKAYALSVKPTP